MIVVGIVYIDIELIENHSQFHNLKYVFSLNLLCMINKYFLSKH